MKEVKILMDEKRSLYIQDEDGTIYDFWPQGLGIPVIFGIKTKEEQIKDDEEREKRDKEWLEERRIKRDNRTFFKKLFG